MRTLFELALEHWVITAFITLFVLSLLAPTLTGAVLIRERQVGIVVKKFGSNSLPPGRLIALQGEAGYQADTLPPGLHFGYFRCSNFLAS